MAQRVAKVFGEVFRAIPTRKEHTQQIAQNIAVGKPRSRASVSEVRVDQPCHPRLVIAVKTKIMPPNGVIFSAYFVICIYEAPIAADSGKLSLHPSTHLFELTVPAPQDAGHTTTVHITKK